MASGSGDHQGPLRHLVAVDDGRGIVAVDGGLRSPGDFIGGLVEEGGQLGVGKGQDVHREKRPPEAEQGRVISTANLSAS